MKRVIYKKVYTSDNPKNPIIVTREAPFGATIVLTPHADLSRNLVIAIRDTLNEVLAEWDEN